MDLIREGFAEAWRLIASGDRGLLHALKVSLVTSVLAVLFAAVLAIPFGAWLGLFHPRGHRTWAFVLRVALGIPTVVIGLFVYVLLTRQGVLGEFERLHTVVAITIGQTLLAFPILATHMHAATEALDRRVAETAVTLGAGRWRTMFLALGEVRPALVVAVLYAFGRCVTELGIALMVGGNVLSQTRTLPGMIQIEVNNAEFGKALAPALVLLAIAITVSVAAPLVLRERRR
jgi:tungstate transport system permease protein